MRDGAPYIWCVMKKEKSLLYPKIMEIWRTRKDAREVRKYYYNSADIKYRVCRFVPYYE